MPVEIVRRGAGKKYPARRLKNAATRILELLKRDHTELSVALIGNGEMRIEGVRLTFLLVSCFRKRSKRFA